MKIFLLSIFSCFCLCIFLSCGEQQAHQQIKTKDTTTNNPHKVEDSAKTIIERANQNIKDSLKQ